MPLDLSDIEETRSLLVPAYGVTHDISGVAPDLGPSLRLGPCEDADTYRLMHRDDWYVQPRGTTRFLFGTSAIFNDAIGPRGERHVIRLRETHETLPDNLANTCLMVGGLRTCARQFQDRSDIVHGYAAWAESSGPHRWISSTTLAADVPAGCVTKNVAFGRAGRGALYAPVGDGKARILLLDFHLADRAEDSPDLLIVQASCTEIRLGGIPHLDPFGKRLGDDWHALILDAVDGFRLEHGP